MISSFSLWEKTSILDAHGGGVVNVAAFVLQVIVLALTKPKLAKVMMLDESFRNVSREYLSRVAELLKKLNKITGIQFILVTHKHELAEDADKIFEVKKDENGKTIIKEIGYNIIKEDK